MAWWSALAPVEGVETVAQSLLGRAEMPQDECGLPAAADTRVVTTEDVRVVAIVTLVVELQSGLDVPPRALEVAEIEAGSPQAMVCLEQHALIT